MLRNDDLYLRAPVLRLDGAGAVDLPQRTVDYRITPRIATTLEGQDASGTPVLQAGIPFLVQGPFASPSVRFDLNGTLTSAVGSPADLARVAADLARTRRPCRRCATSSTCSTSCLPPPPAERATSSRVCSAAGEIAPSAPRARVHPALRTGRGDCSKGLAASGQAQTEATLRDPPGTQAAQAEFTTLTSTLVGSRSAPDRDPTSQPNRLDNTEAWFDFDRRSLARGFSSYRQSISASLLDAVRGRSCRIGRYGVAMIPVGRRNPRHALGRRPHARQPATPASLRQTGSALPGGATPTQHDTRAGLTYIPCAVAAVQGTVASLGGIP